MMRCVFCCLGIEKPKRKRITIPSKHQGHGSNEIITPIKGIIVQRKKIEDSNMNSLKKHINTTEKNEGPEKYLKGKKEDVEKIEQIQAQSDSTMSSLFSYPINYKYEKRSSTEEDGSETGHDHGTQQESSDSLFSISINSRKQSEKGEKEVNSPMKVHDFQEKETKIIVSNQSLEPSSRLIPIDNITRSDPSIYGKLITTYDQGVTINFRGENLLLKQRFDFSEAADKVTRFIKSDQNVQIDPIFNPDENSTQSQPGRLGEMILVDDQEEKENVNVEQEKKCIFHPRSCFSVTEHKIDKVLKPKENHIEGKSRRFFLTDGEEENESSNLVLVMRGPNSENPSLKNSSKFAELTVKEVLVDTSLSSWLVEPERERDSPESIKNSPCRENNPARRYNDDNKLNMKDGNPIIGTVGCFLES